MKRFLSYPALMLLSLFFPSSLCAASTENVPSQEVSDAIQKVFPALVLIHVVMEEGADGRMKKLNGSGSGTIITKEGHVLTNHHVAGRGTRFVCTLSNREEVDATLVGTDPLADLAVLKLDLSTRRLKDEQLVVADFGDSDTLKTGDVVFAMGSPGGLSQSVTRGIVANTAMIMPKGASGLSLDGESVGELVRWIGHDAIIFPGNSGGPLVNPAGQIVGVNEVGIASLGGAIPANLAKKVSEQLIAHGTVTRSWIGLEVQPLLRNISGQKGALVATVWKDSPADKAGIKPGDFLLSYQGVSIPDCYAPEDIPVFNAMVLNTLPGIKVALTGIREDKPQTWELNTEIREATRSRETEIREWGFTARDFTRLLALEKSRESKDGVLVDTVRTGSPASEAKPSLASGDAILKVGGKVVKSRADLVSFTSEFLKGSEAPRPLLVEFDRDGQKLATVVKIGAVADPVKPRLAEKSWLGAGTQVLTDELAIAYDLAGKKGVRITRLAPDSPAKLAGIEVGDILLQLDGKVINARRPEDSDVFEELILAYPVGSDLELSGRRGSQDMKWKAKLKARPIDDSELLEYKDERFEFTVRQISSSQREQAREAGGEEIHGVSVLKVEPNGWASLGGLAADDVILNINGKPLEDIETLKATLKQLSEIKPRSVILGIRRGPRTQFLEIEPRW